MRSPLAYVPRRTPLADAGALAAGAYLGSLALVAFLYSNPIVLAGAGAGVVVAGVAAKATDALRASARWGLALGLFIVAINGLVAQRGETIVFHGLWLPLFGSSDVSAEAFAEGAVLALRITVVLMAFAVHSACVDPDRVLRLLRPLARHSALTATLIARMVPLAAADYARLGEAAALRGPAAAPVGRAALARRLVAGSLDRAVDVAATLELRGYAHGPPRAASGRPRSRHDARFAGAGAAIAAIGIAGRSAGVGSFDPYPFVSIDPVGCPCASS
ncbi:MAG: energy-coupling factor transporter transmembrane component T, partial [Solirubrobacterales bacterium]